MIVLAIIIYFLLNFCYKFFFEKSEFCQAYILNKNVSRGEEITKDMVKQINIDKKDLSNESLLNIEQIAGYISSDGYIKGQILLDSMVIKKDKYISGSDKKELVSIKISNPEDALSYQIAKSCIINIYYTGKAAQAEQIVNKEKFPSINSSSKTEGYVTLNVMQNVEVKNVFDRYGNILEPKNITRNDASLIDTIMVETDKDTVMKLNNLKSYGIFSISLVR